METDKHQGEDEFSFETFGAEDNEIDPFDLARSFLNYEDVSEGGRGQAETTGGVLRRTAPRTAVLRTSDRLSYRRCRRMWNWSHSARGNLQSARQSGPFWLGTGMHFALEDFHGYHEYPFPREALQDYYRATCKTGFVPDEVDELYGLGVGMLDYYEQWLESREQLQTLIIDGVPQVEVNVHIEIPKEHILKYLHPALHHILDRYDRILYSLTLDRVVLDSYGRLWIVEYKSAKQYQWAHLDTDNQVTAYKWGAQYKYPGYEIAGTIYQQHKKQVLTGPAFLSSTKKFSTSKRQKTSYALYLSSLRSLYGNDYTRYPYENQLFLEYLKTQESQNADELIKRDYVERNQQQSDSEYQKILMEASEMLNPELPIYPNPTRDCSWQCTFNGACVAYDAGEDWQSHIADSTMSRVDPIINWRKLLHGRNSELTY